MNEFAEYNYLCHYGILGMKWGVRRYQNKDGSLTPVGRKHYGGSEKDRDITIRRGTKLQTLSSDKDRTKNADFFYAAYTDNDKEYYKGLFSIDRKKKVAGIVPTRKFNINNKLIKDVKVASEKTGVQTMSKLYKENDDFRNFIDDPNRLLKMIPKPNAVGSLNRQSYKEALNALKTVKEKGGMTDEDATYIYRLFNYELPNDGRGDETVAEDIASQRNKFFSELKSAGYGAVIDTNDSYYGNFGQNVQSAVVVFDTDSFVPDTIKKVKYSEVLKSGAKATLRRGYRKFTNTNA